MKHGFIYCELLVFLVLGCRPANLYMGQYRASVREFEEQVEASAANRRAMLAKGKVLDLRDCVELALGNSRNLKIAELESEIALDRIDLARSYFLPKFTVGVGYQYLLRTPGHSSDSSLDGNVYGHLLSAKANLIVPIYDFGGTAANYQLAKIKRFSKKASERRARQQVIYRVTNAYFNVLSLMHLEIIAGESLKQAKEHLRQTQDFLAEDIVDKKDMLQSKVRVAQAKQWLYEIENNHRLAVAALNKILGVELSVSSKLEDIREAAVGNPTLENCLQRSELRPDLYALSQQIKAARAGLDATKAACYPRIYGVGSYNYLGPRLHQEGADHSLNLDDNVLMGGVMIDWNLFDGGRTTAKIAETEKRWQQAKLAYREMESNVKLQVQSAYYALEEARKKLEVTQAAVEQAKESLRILNEQYREQVVSSTDILDGQTLLTKTEIDHIRAAYSWRIARAVLELAMGVDENFEGNIDGEK